MGCREYAAIPNSPSKPFNPLPSCMIVLQYIHNAMLNYLQKYYHPGSFICACTMPKSKKGRQKVTTFGKPQYFVGLSLLLVYVLYSVFLQHQQQKCKDINQDNDDQSSAMIIFVYLSYAIFKFLSPFFSQVQTLFTLSQTTIT